MSRKDDSRIIMILHPICSGLDVHKESVSVCVVFPDSNGDEHYEVKVFGTFTDDLIRLRECMPEHDCPVSWPWRALGFTGVASGEHSVSIPSNRGNVPDQYIVI